MFPTRFAPLLIALILSGLMTFVVSAIATWNAIGFPQGYFSIWMGSWLFTWIVAFPVLIVMRPLTMKIVAKLTA